MPLLRVLLAVLIAGSCWSQTPAEIRGIAQQAYFFAYPLVQVPDGVSGQVPVFVTAGNIASNGITVWVQ